jgi:predicted N-acetyltransferase YhbS
MINGTTSAQGTRSRGESKCFFVAVSRQAVLGSASLVAYDMDTRMDLSPWLASVYVATEHRRQGIGTALVRRVVQEAEALGVQALHLYTPDKEPFYACLGWSVIERTTYQSYPQVVMTLPIAGRPPGAGR